MKISSAINNWYDPHVSGNATDFYLREDGWSQRYWYNLRGFVSFETTWPTWLFRWARFLLTVEARVPTSIIVSLKTEQSSCIWRGFELACPSKNTRIVRCFFVLSVCASSSTARVMTFLAVVVTMSTCQPQNVYMSSATRNLSGKVRWCRQFRLHHHLTFVLPFFFFKNVYPFQLMRW